MRLACLCRSRDRSGGMAKVGLWLRYLSVGLSLWLVLLAPTVAHADGVFTPFVGMSAGNDQTEKVTTYGASLAGMAGGIFGFELDYGRTADAKTNSVFVKDSRVTTLNGNVLSAFQSGRFALWGRWFGLAP